MAANYINHMDNYIIMFMNKSFLESESLKYLFHILFWNDETMKSYSISVMYLYVLRRIQYQNYFIFCLTNFISEKIYFLDIREFLNEFSSSRVIILFRIPKFLGLWQSNNLEFAWAKFFCFCPFFQTLKLFAVFG